MTQTQAYFAAVKSAFPRPSKAMAAYIAGFDHRETDTELEAQQRRWEALTEEEQATCREIARGAK